MFKLTDMPNQARILVDSHTDFSLFVTKPALNMVLSTNSDVVSDYENANLIPKPSSKKQAIPIACRCQYFINGRTTLVNTKGALLSPKGRK